MSLAIEVPEVCVKYIRWQRSRFRPDCVRDAQVVKQRYAQMIAEEFTQMEPYLPARVDSITDIGCGMAAIDVLLKRKYPGATLTLLDGDGEDVTAAGTPQETGRGGWNQTLGAYNSRQCASALLACNGVQEDGWLDIGTAAPIKSDLIVSLGSCGFHYPFDTYRQAGFIVCDLRTRNEAARIAGLPQRGGVRIATFAKSERWGWLQ